MKKILLALALVATAAHADCITNTIVNKDGTMTVCTTCCNNGQCYTTCM